MAEDNEMNVEDFIDMMMIQMGDGENEVDGRLRVIGNLPIHNEVIVHLPGGLPWIEQRNQAAGNVEDARANQAAGDAEDARANQSSSIYDKTDTVSAMHKCQTSNATKLVIYDLFEKLKEPDTYDIGGTYTGEDPDAWFYYTTTVCPGPACLLNLFVYHRKSGSISIGISSTNEMSFKKISSDLLSPKQAVLSNVLTWYHIKSGEKDQSHYIKTFKFTDKDVKSLENVTVYIPLRIKLSKTPILDNTILKKIKLSHDFRDLLAQQEKTDFVLESLEQKQFPTHKIILAAHGSVFREILKNSTTNSIVVELNNKDMELLIEFIYTGTIQDIANQDCLKLLTIADKFQLKNLFTLTQYAISAQINVNNAIEIAVLSEKYKLDELQTRVFEFIRNNQNVLETEGWNNLSDLMLTKKLLQYMHRNSNMD